MEQTVNAPKTKRGQRTLDRILKESERLFYEKGYHNTSVVDITTASEIGLGTFYIYFNDKYSLYKHLLLHYSRDIRKAIVTDIQPHHTRVEQEEIGLRTFLKYIHRNKHIYNIIWESLYIDKSLFKDYYESFGRRYRVGLDAAKEQGEIRESDTTIMAYFLMGISNFVGLKYVVFDDVSESELDRIVDEVMGYLKHGIFNTN